MRSKVINLAERRSKREPQKLYKFSVLFKIQKIVPAANSKEVEEVILNLMTDHFRSTGLKLVNYVIEEADA
jgi:hypothetical protein